MTTTDPPRDGLAPVSMAASAPAAPEATPASAPPPDRSRFSRKPVRHDDGRLVKGRASRARIREAALSLFQQRGFDRATLREIGREAGMGASSIYRHVRSKEELLVDELARWQEEAWTRFRASDDRTQPTRDRIARFLDAHHELLAENPDLTTIALRAATHPEARVAKRVLAMQDRSIGLLAEILQRGRARGDVGRDADVLVAARAILYTSSGARLAWANGQVSMEGCRAAIAGAVDLLFRGLAGPASRETRKPG